MVHAVSNGSGVESNGRDGEHRSVKRVGCAIQGGGLDGGVDGEREAEPRRQHGLGCHFELLQLGLLQSLGLGPPVLEPDFDLCLCEVEGAGELGPLGDGQVLLLAELALQGQQLRGGERGAGLPIRLVLPQRAGSGAQVSCKEGRAGYHSGRDTPGLCCLSRGSPPGVPRVPSKHGLLQRGGSANLVLTDLQLTALQLVKGIFFPQRFQKGQRIHRSLWESLHRGLKHTKKLPWRLHSSRKVQKMPQKQEIPKRRAQPCSRISPLQVTAEKTLTVSVVSLTGHFFFLIFFLPNQVFPPLINFDEWVSSDKSTDIKTKLKQKSSAFNSTLSFYDICQLKKKTEPRQNSSISLPIKAKKKSTTFLFLPSTPARLGNIPGMAER